MSTVRGQDGSASVAGNTIGELRSWSLDGVTIETIDDTVKGDTHRTFLGGLADGGTATINCWYDGSDGGQSAVLGYFGATVQSAGVTVVLTAATGKTFTFLGVPQSYRPSSPEGSALVDIGFVFKVSGVVTDAWA